VKGNTTAYMIQSTADYKALYDQMNQMRQAIRSYHRDLEPLQSDERMDALYQDLDQWLTDTWDTWERDMAEMKRRGVNVDFGPLDFSIPPAHTLARLEEFQQRYNQLLSKWANRQAMLDFETGQRLRAMREAGDEVPEEEINRHMTMQGAYRMAQRLTEADSTKVERQARPFSFLNWLKSWW